MRVSVKSITDSGVKSLTQSGQSDSLSAKRRGWAAARLRALEKLNLQHRDLRLVLLHEARGLGLVDKGSRLVLGHLDSKQVARHVVPLG